MSLKSKILEYLKQEYPRVIHKGEIGRKAVLEWGYENENAGRRCRELETAGLIKKIENEKHEAQYQFVQTSKEVEKPKTINFLYPINETGKVWKL